MNAGLFVFVDSLMFGSGGEDENLKEDHKSLGELASKKSGQGDGCRSRTGELCCNWAPSLSDGEG